LAATVFTDQLPTVQRWLENYFGFSSHIDWLDSDNDSGKVICRRDGLEITICGVEKPSVEIQFVVDDISQLSDWFKKDGIKHHFDRDAGERPIIHFPKQSPFSAFVIEEESHER
jgi:hypothetical protein